MKNRNMYVNDELGFSIEKPQTWIFIPKQWAINLLLNRVEPPTKENAELLKYAQEPLVYFHYDHRIMDQVLPTVQVMHRMLVGVDTIDRPTFLRMQLIQLDSVFRNFDLIEATSDGIISARPANIIKSTFTVYNQEGYEMECLSRCYLIFSGDSILAVEMSGPVEGEFRCEEEFKDILTSIRIDEK